MVVMVAFLSATEFHLKLEHKRPDVIAWVENTITFGAIYRSTENIGQVIPFFSETSYN